MREKKGSRVQHIVFPQFVSHGSICFSVIYFSCHVSSLYYFFLYGEYDEIASMSAAWYTPKDIVGCL